MKLTFSDGSVISRLEYIEVIQTIGSFKDVVVFSTDVERFGLTIGQTFKIEIVEGFTIFSGRIRRIDSMGGKIYWTAESLPSILSETCPIHSTGEFKNRTTRQIIEELASPFGVEVSGADGERFQKYNIELDTTCSETIYDLCMNSGVVPFSDSNGTLALSSIESVSTSPKSTTRLVEGSNCVEIMLELNDKFRYSNYRALGQKPFNELGDTKLKRDVAGTSNLVKQNTFIVDIPTNRGLIQKQANRLAYSGEGGVETLVVKLSEINVFIKGMYCHIESVTNRVNGIRMVESIVYKIDNGVTSTEVYLVPPIKYGGPVVELSGWLG